MSSTCIHRRGRPAVGAVLALGIIWMLTATAEQAPAAARPPGLAAQGPLLPLTPAEVLAHVSRSVSWYHDLSALEQINLPGVSDADRGQLQQQVLAAVQLAFEFGKAAEDILGKRQTQSQAHASGASAAGGARPTLSAQLAQAATNLSTQAGELKSQLAAVDARLRRVRSARARSSLAAQRAGITAALQLVQEIEGNINQLRRFQQSAIAGQGKPPKGLRGQLAYLEKSIPALASGEAQGAGAAEPPTGAAGHAASAASASKAAATNFQPQSAGLLALIGQWFKLYSYRGQIESATRQTSGLESELTDTRSQVLATVRKIVGGGLASIATGSSAQLAAQRQAIETATGQLRELSSVFIPLDKQALAVSGAQTTLEEWNHTLAAQESSVAGYLGIRAGILLAWIAAVLIIAEVWRRVTLRYLPDSRRRRPFLMLRRVLLGIALILVVIFNLVSQFGSVATYAGFVTAGLAVALQNVILAVVAYFFLIGRYGVRVGDRVTISGVTGRVVDISLLRIYLMELAGPDLHSTGRMVVLSNAVLFQPTALFKQIPGAEYLWHSVTLTIVATADVEKAYSSLRSAANRVYETYRSAIQRQHDLAQRFIEFETAAPEPEVRLRLTDNGLECSVRYPVVAEKAARIDQQMLDALRKAVEGDEQLKLIASGGMALKSSES